MFPCWRYHKDPKKSDLTLFQDVLHPAPKEYGARIFKSQEELDKEEGWVDHPEKLKKEVKKDVK